MKKLSKPRKADAAPSPKLVREIRKLAGTYAPDAIEALRAIFQKDDGALTPKVAAAEAMLDRAIGRPSPHPTAPDFSLDDMTEEELESFVKALAGDRDDGAGGEAAS
jgi:hypothetical protein